MKWPATFLTVAAATFGLSVATAGTAPKTEPKQSFVWPEQMKNRQVLPPEFAGDRLRRTMVSFSRSLGVRCTHCHVGEEGAPLSTLDFVSDTNPRKNIAREMLRMVTRINRDNLRQIPGLIDPVSVTCYTCHRGQTKPAFRVPEPPAEVPAAQQSPTERG